MLTEAPFAFVKALRRPFMLLLLHQSKQRERKRERIGTVSGEAGGDVVLGLERGLPVGEDDELLVGEAREVTGDVAALDILASARLASRPTVTL